MTNALEEIPKGVARLQASGRKRGIGGPFRHGDPMSAPKLQSKRAKGLFAGARSDRPIVNLDAILRGAQGARTRGVLATGSLVSIALLVSRILS